MRAKHLILLATIALAPYARAAEAPTATASAPSDLASLLEGEFTTLPAPIEQPVAPVPQTEALYAVAKRVDVPALGHYVVYSELHKGSADGPIVRQTLYSLQPPTEGAGIKMIVYSPVNPRALAGGVNNPALLANLKPSDVQQFPAGCEMIWRRIDDGFAGDVESDHCIAARATHLIASKTSMIESQRAIGNSGSSSPESQTTGKDTTFRRLR